MLIALASCAGPSLDPTSREPQRVEAPWGDVVALLPSEAGPILVTHGGAVRIGTRVEVVELGVAPPITAGAVGPARDLLVAWPADGTSTAARFLKGATPTLAVGGGPGPHGEHDGWLVTLPDRRESWLGGPEWEVLHAVASFEDGWLVAGVGTDRRGPVEVSGALWVARLDAALVPRWERRLHGGLDHVAAVVTLGDRAVVLALEGRWDDVLKPLTAWVVRADGGLEVLPADLGRVRAVAAVAAGPGRILVATTDQAGHPFVRWLDVP